MKVLITGGAGFVGSNLGILFKKEFPDWDIIALDNLYRRGSELNLARLNAAGIEFLHGDIRVKDDLSMVKDFELLIECSAEASAAAGFNNTSNYLIQTNLMGTVNCMEACVAKGADIIFLSTSRVYPTHCLSEMQFYIADTRFELAPDIDVRGASAEYGISEAFSLDGPRTLYGATKLCSEILLKEYIEFFNLKGVVNRCGVLTGPWQMGKVDQGFVVLWMARHLWGGGLSYIGYGGEGHQVRDILHVKDLFSLLKKQIREMPAISGETFNVGGGKQNSISLRELSDQCAEITGNTLDIQSVPKTRVTDIPYYISDCRKLSAHIEWMPELDTHTILSDIHTWLVRNEKTVKPLLIR